MHTSFVCWRYLAAVFPVISAAFATNQLQLHLHSLLSLFINVVYISVVHSVSYLYIVSRQSNHTCAYQIGAVTPARVDWKTKYKMAGSSRLVVLAPKALLPGSDLPQAATIEVDVSTGKILEVHHGLKPDVASGAEVLDVDESKILLPGLIE